MKLRLHTFKTQWWQWESREDFWGLRETKHGPILQYFDDNQQQWFSVPQTEEIKGPGPKPKD